MPVMARLTAKLNDKANKLNVQANPGYGNATQFWQYFINQ